MVLLVAFMVLAVGGVIGMYLRDSRYSRRISDRGNEYLESFEAAPPDRSDD